jgi:hypothetical protein
MMGDLKYCIRNLKERWKQTATILRGRASIGEKDTFCSFDTGNSKNNGSKLMKNKYLIAWICLPTTNMS